MEAVSIRNKLQVHTERQFLLGRMVSSAIEDSCRYTLLHSLLGSSDKPCLACPWISFHSSSISDLKGKVEACLQNLREEFQASYFKNKNGKYRGIVNRKHKTWKICFSYNQFNLPSRRQLKIDDNFEDFFKAYLSKMLFYYTYYREGESTYLSLKPSAYRLIQEQLEKLQMNNVGIFRKTCFSFV